MQTSRTERCATLPKVWYMSIAGSVLCLAYFIFGKNGRSQRHFVNIAVHVTL